MSSAPAILLSRRESWRAALLFAFLPANYAFRAVVVPAGRSRIEFRYWPPGLTTGLWVSAVSAVLVIGLALVPGKRAAGGREQSLTP